MHTTLHTPRTTRSPRERLALIGALALALVMALLPFTAPADAQEDDGTPDALDLTGSDPIDYAIAWSQVTYTPLTGEVEAPPSEALLGRDDLFADNLAAGALMGQAIEGGRPLYLTGSATLAPETLEEMQRVLPEGATVHILGGTEAISPVVEVELTAAGFTVNRFEGETRTETAIAVAEATDSDTVLVVRAFPAEGATDETQAFADSLGAGAVAAANGWEILFTQTSALTGSTATALEEGGYTQAYVVGGTSAIDEEVQADIAAIVGATTRVAGDTRFETAVALNELREGALGEIAIIVDGQADDAWADGFPAANISGLNGYPLVLSNQGEIPAPTRDFLQGADGGDMTFADHLQGIALICGATVDTATCQAALDLANGAAGGEVLPFPGTPDEPEEPMSLTDAPELQSVEVVESDEDSARLRFTFDEQITGGTAVAECFHLYAFDQVAPTGADEGADCTTAGGGHGDDVNANPASADGTAATIPTDDATAVLVTFAVTAEELASATVATVDWAAVTDDDGIENLEGRALLEPTLTGGTTAAPDLVEVRTFTPAADTVEFVFDEQVAPEAIDPEGFVLVDASGDTMVSDSAERSDTTGQESVVVASFTDAANDEETLAEGEESSPGIDPTTQGDVVRAGVLAGSVAGVGAEDGEGINPLQVVELAAGGTTADPDLVSVMVDREDDTVTYRFDVPVEVLGGQCASIGLDGIPVIGDATATPETCFQAYGRDGAEVDATAVERSTTNTLVVATFPPGALDSAVGASVEADAVAAVQGDENPGNEIDELPIEDLTIEGGRTIGPDLVSAAVVTSDALETETVVEYTFDEAVVAAEPDPITGGPLSPDASRFFIYAADGTPTRGETAQVDPDDDTVVQVVFDENEEVIANAVTATVNDLAVLDEDGDANTEASAGTLR